jgi:dolichyl-phosphate-mannose-protein mannosyltransferase
MRLAGSESLVQEPGWPASSPITSRFSRVYLWSRSDRLELVLIPALLLLIALATFRPIFSADFSLVDDHEILSYSPSTLSHPEVGPPDSLAQRVLVSDVAIGRFRPLYWVIRFAEIALLGASPLAWHILYVLIGVASAGAIYAALRQIGVARFAALIAAVWLLVCDGFSAVWITLGPQESLGTLFLALAVWAAAHSWKADRQFKWIMVLLGAAIAAMLTKESFVLVVPALAAFNMYVAVRRAGRAALNSSRTLAPSIMLLGLSALDLLATFLIAKTAGASSYGGSFLSFHATDIELTEFNVVKLAWIGGAVILVAIPAVPLDWLRGRMSSREKQDWAIGILLFGLALAPQLVLYRHAVGFVVGRYMLPTGVAIAMAVAVAMSWLGHQRRVLLWLVYALACLGIIGHSAITSWAVAENFRADTAAVHALVDQVVESAPEHATVLVALNDGDQIELASSIVGQIAFRGRADIDVHAIVVPSTADQQSPPPEIIQLTNGAFPGRVDDVDTACAHDWAVVLLAAEELTNKYAPCYSDPLAYSRAEFPGRVWGIYGGDRAYILLRRRE